MVARGGYACGPCDGENRGGCPALFRFCPYLGHPVGTCTIPKPDVDFKC